MYSYFTSGVPFKDSRPSSYSNLTQTSVSKPFRRAHPGTLGQWIKDCLRRAGVDTGRFTPHSTRSPSSSQARARGIPIVEILKVANWSSRSIFEHFYYKSEGYAAFNRAILQPEHFSRCFKCTTS